MDGFSTKQKGDVAEYRVITGCLRRGVNVLKPLGDRLPYDLAIERNGQLLRVQVKLTWFEQKSRNYQVDIRRSQTNRKVYKHTKYNAADSEYLIAWLEDLDVFYIFPLTSLVVSEAASAWLKEYVGSALLNQPSIAINGSCS